MGDVSKKSRNNGFQGMSRKTLSVESADFPPSGVKGDKHICSDVDLMNQWVDRSEIAAHNRESLAGGGRANE
jgi:hypothetical protein